MGADENRQLSRTGSQSAPHLPRYVIKHIGQVLRNRTRENLLIPVPNEMLKVLEVASQSSALMS